MLIVLPLLLSSLAQARTLTIAVIDTGIDKGEANLCRMGHKSFVTHNPKLMPAAVDPGQNPLIDQHGHGTHVAGLINQNASEGDFCLVALKYYSDTQSGAQNLDAMRRAIQYAINIKVDFINISGGGPEPAEQERFLINKGLNAGITIVVAAGNEHSDLGKKCDYFPACYDHRLVVVGNLQKSKDYKGLNDDWKRIAAIVGMSTEVDLPQTTRSPSSNYGTYVNRWEVGTDCTSTLPDGKTGQMSGTSQATAVATGKLVKERLAKH